jgi:hypothetical protein
MRYWIYDDEGMLFRKFYSKDEASKFIQEGWTLIVKPKHKKVLPSVEVYGEARW